MIFTKTPIITKTSETIAMATQSLPGIRKIQIIKCADLTPNCMMMAQSGCIIAIAADAIDVDFVGFPSLEWEDSKKNGERFQTSTLQFSTVSPIECLERIAFVISTAQGHQVLIGAREPSYPLVSLKAYTGQPRGQSAVYTYKVTHKAVKSVLTCIL